MDPDKPRRFVLGLSDGGAPVYLHYDRDQARSHPSMKKNIIIEQSGPAPLVNFLSAQLLIKNHDVVALSPMDNPLPLCTRGDSPSPVPSYFRQNAPDQQRRPYFESTPTESHLRLDTLTTPRNLYQALPLVGSRPMAGWVVRGDYVRDNDNFPPAILRDPAVLGLFVRNDGDVRWLMGGVILRAEAENTYHIEYPDLSSLNVQPSVERLHVPTLPGSP